MFEVFAVCFITLFVIAVGAAIAGHILLIDALARPQHDKNENRSEQPTPQQQPPRPMRWRRAA